MNGAILTIVSLGILTPGLTAAANLATASAEWSLIADPATSRECGTMKQNGVLDVSNIQQSKNELYDNLLDTLYSTFGIHKGYRVAHSKGILTRGYFMATPQAATLSRALHLQGGKISVVMRFSNFSGIPQTPDGDMMASPRGLGIQFELAPGVVTDIVAHSYNGFPVGTSEEFLTFLQGIAEMGASPPSSAKLDAFFKTHPLAKAFLETPKPSPSSYVREHYYGINSFTFVNKEGKRQYVRYRIDPVEKSDYLTEQEAAKRTPNYLSQELADHLKKAPAQMRLMVQLAQPEDNVEDGSHVWPNSGPHARKEVELGTFTIESIETDSLTQQQYIVFDPGLLTDGIELSPDPMVEARHQIYQRAMLRRNSEG